MSQMTALEQRITDQYLSYAYPDEPQQDLEQAAMQATVGTLPEDTKNITAAQFGKMAMDVPAGLLKGGVQASIGLSGDMIDLVKGAISVFNRPPGQGWLDAFLQGTGGRTVLPTTDDVRKFIDETLGMPLVPASETDPMRREAAKVPEFIGELGGAGKTMVAGARGAAAAGKAVANQMSGKSKSFDSIAIDFKPDTNFLSAKSNAGMVGGHVQKNSLRITYAEVEEKSRGQGKGIELYQSLIDNALSKGLTVTSDVTVEAPAVRVYEALKKRGYNVEKSEGGVLEDGTVYGKGASSPVFTITAGPKK